MRIKIFAILFLLLLALLAMSACCIRWDNPGSQSVDQMFTKDNRSLDDMSATRTVNTGSFSSGSHISESSGMASFGEETSMDAQSNEESLGAKSDDQIQSESTNSAALSGKWSMEFNFGSPPKATLNLFQHGDAIYGTGAIIPDIKTSLMAAASGSVMGNQLNLDIISLGNVSLYRISMTVIGNTASGTYTAYRPSASPISGTATALRSPDQSRGSP